MEYVEEERWQGKHQVDKTQEPEHARLPYAAKFSAEHQLDM